MRRIPHEQPIGELQSICDILHNTKQKDRNAGEQEGEAPQQDAARGSTILLRPPVPSEAKGSKRISSPPLIEVDAFGRQKIDMGFIAREFASIGLPHSDPGDLRVYYRTNGQLQFRVSADPDSFLPYGMYPRLLGAWVATEACRKQSRTIQLGRNLSGSVANVQ